MIISKQSDAAVAGEDSLKDDTPKGCGACICSSWVQDEEFCNCHRQMGSYWEFGFEFIELAVVPAFCTLRTDRLQTFV